MIKWPLQQQLKGLLRGCILVHRSVYHVFERIKNAVNDNFSSGRLTNFHFVLSPEVLPKNKKMQSGIKRLSNL
jgi:hypothetical protein